MSNKIKDVEISQATADDVRMFFPNGLPRSSYCWMAKYKDKPACLAGITLEKGGTMIYSEIAADIDAPKITIWRTARVLLELIRSVGLPMATVCLSNNPRAQEFVKRLGFTHTQSMNGLEYFV